jgi:hypothetical protein
LFERNPIALGRQCHVVARPDMTHLSRRV